VIDHHGRSIPVIDPLRLLDLGALDAATESPVLILRCGADGRVGLRIDAVHDMVSQAREDVLPMPALAVADPSCFDGVTLGKGDSQYLVLSADGLRALDQIEAYARLSGIGHASSTVGGTHGLAHAARDQVVVFTAGARAALPLLQLQEVIAYPEVVTAMAGVRPHLIGLFDHRGKPIPLLALDQALGAGAAGPRTRVLLVSSEGETVGFAVEVLHGIEPARRMQPHDRRATGHVATRPSMDSLVEIGADGGEILPLLDLQALMRALVGRVPAAAPTAQELAVVA
jgi:chemotaxis signal transduction protein